MGNSKFKIETKIKVKHRHEKSLKEIQMMTHLSLHDGNHCPGSVKNNDECALCLLLIFIAINSYFDYCFLCEEWELFSIVT